LTEDVALPEEHPATAMDTTAAATPSDARRPSVDTFRWIE
jgi:hypothetical protein